MTNVIQFPNNNFNKNTRKVVKVNKSNRNSFILMSSLLSLVMALSIFNKKIENGFNSPTSGMRGLASVDDSQFTYDDKKLIKLINSKNSRKIASLGIAGSKVDDLVFGELAEKFQITRSHLNIITSIERIKDGSLENEIQFEKEFLDKYKEAFGAIYVKAKNEFQAQGDSSLLSTYDLYNSEGEVFAQAKVLTSEFKDLISISIDL